MKYIKAFDAIDIDDIGLVGGKNASLGQMIQALSKKGIRVPQGFAITADAYWHYIEYNNLYKPIKLLLAELSQSSHLSAVEKNGERIRALIEDGQMPADLRKEIIIAYHVLSDYYGKNLIDVAVRSSATAEDLPGASFAGQQETYLNIKGDDQLIEACKLCFASLFTNRAIIYRQEKGFDHLKVALSIGVQKMVRSDLASSGVAFSLDTETGFKDVVLIEAAYGLGEVLVQGKITPDEYRVFKPLLNKSYEPIISKRAGNKDHKLVYGAHATKKKKIDRFQARQFCLSDGEIIELAEAVVIIEHYYSQLKKAWTPMDVEWAKDGVDGKLYIVQARPETVHALEHKTGFLNVYTLQQSKDTLTILAQGLSIGQKIASGNVAIIKNLSSMRNFNEEDVLVTTMTDPDWLPLMKKASAIITDLGGRTCHAAIVSRELGVPALVGTGQATSILRQKQAVTVDCSQGSVGYVYEGLIPFAINKIDSAKLKKPSVELLVNIADPSQAFVGAQLPFVQGVGLARTEFIIAHTIQAHPMAFINPERIDNKKVLRQLDELTLSYKDKKQFFVDSLAYGVATIAAAFYPRRVIVRFSDFKTNEYGNLIGGSYFEPNEANPMLGLRGASRYYNPLYEQAFLFEIEAIKKARDQIGLRNIAVMVPFVRTVAEAKKIIQLLEKHGLKSGKKDLHIVMMVEIPSNVILIDEFSKYFDGFSIGSNDLTQFTLAVDRDSSLLAETFDERDQAVKELMKLAIEGAHRNKKYIGICGQAPSDYQEISAYLIKCGIDSLSLNLDAVIPFLLV